MKRFVSKNNVDVVRHCRRHISIIVLNLKTGWVICVKLWTQKKAREEVYKI